jgi:hypothetical protein
MEDKQLPFGYNPGLIMVNNDGNNYKELLKLMEEQPPNEREFHFFESKVIDKEPIKESKSVTITLGKENYNTQAFDLGTTVRGGKELRKSLISNPRVKAKMMAYKLRGKVWHPLFTTLTVDSTQPYQHTFTLKSSNF